MHVLPLTEEEARSEQRFWMNERNPLFLSRGEPAQKGIPRFEISFGIDANKMLTISVTDLTDHRQVLSDHPVVRLV